MSEASPGTFKDGIYTCACKGCWACTGKVAECTCDVDWDVVYGDSDSMHTKDFTVEELFNHGGIVDECSECGAHVHNYGKHVAWHNKLLP